MFNREELSIVLNQETIFALVNSSHAGILLRSYRIEKKSELLIRITYGALGGGRTHTWRILSPLPLPLGYEGHVRMGSLLSNSCSFCSLFNHLIEHCFGEFSCKCILLAWMIRANDRDLFISIFECDFCSVNKFCRFDLMT